MNCKLNAAIYSIGSLILSVFTIHNASAAPLSLNLLRASSSITINAVFSGIPGVAQEGTAGTTDLVAGSPSTRTTFQGTITVDVDNFLAPSSIQIVSSAANADISGKWYAQVRPFQDLNGDGSPGDFGLPPDGDSEVGTNNNFGPASDADWGMKVIHPSFGVPIAFGGYRDIAYNVTSGIETVNGLGAFSSLTQHLEPDGFLDYWVAPGVAAAQGLLGRTGANSGDGNFYNNTAPVSTYIVTPLGGGASQITLTIPVLVDDHGSTLRTVYTGQFVATVVIPEPTSVMLLGLGGTMAGVIGARRRT